MGSKGRRERQMGSKGRRERQMGSKGDEEGVLEEDRKVLKEMREG